MRLSSRTQYGLLAMIELANTTGDAPVSLREIAERRGLSEHYLEQLIGPLRAAGLVVSTRGAQGGYRLAQPPAEIRVGDVVRALEGPLVDYDCPDGDRGRDPASRASSVAYVWGLVERAVTDVLDGVTLADLADRERRRRHGEQYVYQI